MQFEPALLQQHNVTLMIILSTCLLQTQTTRAINYPCGYDDIHYL